MVLVRGSEFEMGAVEGDAHAAPDERPRHRVRLADFYVDVHEVTNDQFAAFVAETGHRTQAEADGVALVFDAGREGDPWDQVPGASWRRPRSPAAPEAELDRHPVVLVTWNDATAFAAWAGASLPTEAQFERLLRQDARSGLYPWGSELPPPSRFGNVMDAAFRRARGAGATGAIEGLDDGWVTTAPVGTFLAGPLGTLDVAGNVWEWCRDGFDEAFYERSAVADPWNPPSAESEDRVCRGGGWNTGGGGRLRCSWRGLAQSDVARDYIGFRCVRSP
jgi:formylglycine-generating enzyme required for sulfatase activity